MKQVRLTRLIWSYETEGPNGQLQEPLVSPEYVEHLAEIMGYDLAEEPYLVRDLKAYSTRGDRLALRRGPRRTSVRGEGTARARKTCE